MNDPTASVEIPNLPPQLAGLQKIALNLWWSWNARAQNLFRSIEAYLWQECGHNPIKLLRMLDKEHYEKLLGNEAFLQEYHYVYALFRRYMEQKSDCSDIPPIAYFCAEYGLHRSLPIYSGGLGFLAGDILKEASDMNLPMVGIGFMYPGGYVHQVLDSSGWQQGQSEQIIKEEAPIEKVLDEKGEHLLLQVPLIDPPVYVNVWRVNVGRVSLYLLDTDIEQNDPWDRSISYRLYTSDLHQRLRQQIVLGIGGYAVLERLGIDFSLLHLNEGHPAFALFERLRHFIHKGYDFKKALQKVRQTSVFTTHTPLLAATDVYGFDIVSHYFGDFIKDLGIDTQTLLSFGIDPQNPSDGFNMTALALRLCHYKNAVSKKHQKVAAQMWQKLLEETSSKIEAITNGVHIQTWISGKLEEELDKTLGSQWPRFQEDPDIWYKSKELDNRFIWETHSKHKIHLLSFIQEKARKKWGEGVPDPSIILAEGVMLDPEIFTIGFARRMTEYKRPDLILHDLDRLEKILNHPYRPVQIIFAGKAHPADIPGKKIIQRIFNAAKDPRFQGRIAFVEDYGEELAKYMVKGCDLWLNNPKLPLEACGTSGMKASINGVLHCSTLDGWWPEGYNGKNGWAFGVDPSDDSQDAAQLYDLLEQEIVPLFYDRDEDGLPQGWIERMKEAITSVSPRFSARRMVQEYYDKFYSKIKEYYATSTRRQTSP